MKNIIDASDGERVNDIYYFYQANCKKQEVELNRYDSDLIRLSVDNGDLIVVIDGLDEVITRLGDKFDVKSLLQSIKSNYSSDGEKGKVIITCRDYFWDSQDIDIKNIELRPFNELQMQEYFKSVFGYDAAKIKNAEKLARSFSANETNQERLLKIFANLTTKRQKRQSHLFFYI